MELSAKRRAETWAFYTPKIWANKAVELMCQELWDLRDYIFYDPACWEGALLEALPESGQKFGTTLEAEDVKICEEKWLVVDRLDFFSPSASGFCEYLQLMSFMSGKPIVIFTNPPYFKLKSEQYPELRNKYNTSDSVALFYYRLIDHLKPVCICGFNKCDLRQSPSMRDFREHLANRYWTLEKMFFTPSMSRPWVKWTFPIAFNIIISNRYKEKLNNQK